MIARRVRGQFTSWTKQRLAMVTSTVLLIQSALLVAGRLW